MLSTVKEKTSQISVCAFVKMIIALLLYCFFLSHVEEITIYSILLQIILNKLELQMPQSLLVPDFSMTVMQVDTRCSQVMTSPNNS